MAGKMQPGRFTLRFNMNDPQQQMAVDILNRQGRQKAQFLAQALIHYTECKGSPHTAAPAMVDEHTLEQAVLAILARHPKLLQTAADPAEPVDEHEERGAAQAGSDATVWDEFMSQDSLDAINKALAAFQQQ